MECTISVLAFGVVFSSKWIFPPETVPVVDVVDDRHELFPQILVSRELADPFLCRRATAATLRGE